VLVTPFALAAAFFSFVVTGYSKTEAKAVACSISTKFSL
jgi:hypothetical protein